MSNERRDDPLERDAEQLRESAENVLREGEGTANPERDFHMAPLKASNTGDVTDPAVEYERDRGKMEDDDGDEREHSR
ncbi:MAG: hypothetical protein LC737_09360 [Chloroflexi bacterium]|nr:hypothetical protein [Chloroflexota bacterium]